MNFTEYLLITQIEMQHLFLRAVNTDDETKIKEILDEANALILDMRRQGIEKEKSEKENENLANLETVEKDAKKKKGRFFKL